MLVLCAPVAVAVWPEPSDAVSTTSTARLDASDASLRAGHVSRSLAQRVPLPVQTPAAAEAPAAEVPPQAAPEPTTAPAPEPAPPVVGVKYATASLKVRGAPATDADVLAVVARGSELSVTGVQEASWVQVVHEGAVAWVNGDYVAAEPPAEEQAAVAAGAPSGEPCASGSDVEDGLTPDAIRVHRGVCTAFPSITNYGGTRGSGGEHGVGRAIDIMVSGSLGDEVASWVRANAGVLGVSEVLWAQQIWTVQRDSEGWRGFSDRGSATANHFDHVHVTVYGSSGG